ncbi:MAG TPA: GH92 family glycosyl hydrolase [Bacteroidota bacterium]|nr:GH92 family glycosyl hydrolase [Bacteroidota bacterium]
MIKQFILLLTLCAGIAPGQTLHDYSQYVNPFVGTGGHGHTFPGATLPFGMVQLSPDTRVEGWDACGGYHYSDTSLLGFSHTHLSGTGIADYGDILMVPYIGNVSPSPRRFKFTHDHESASPGYYSVILEEDNIKAELTATARAGVHRYTFPKADGANIIIDLHHGLGPDRVVESNIQFVNTWEIAGMRRSEGWAKNQVVYFVARFSKPAEAFGTIVNDTLHPRARSSSGKNVRAYVRFSTRQDEEVVIKVGLSSVSIDHARKNMIAEVPEFDFDAVRAAAADAWNRELNKIEVEGRDRDVLTTFYTALYHAMISPNLWSDTDGSYRGMDDSIHVADGYDMYTVFSLWDTFRAEHPLLSIIDPKRTLDFVTSLVAKSRESGTLPVWELASNETWTMIGYHAVPVIVDAYMKGIRDFNTELAFAAMKHSAMMDHFGLKAYRDFGYVPGDMESESVSKTLEYAYDDWCISRMAGELGKTSDAGLFARRAQSYKNLFDPSTGLMRPRTNGTWVEPFDPRSVTFHYTEANPWQYSFFAPQDVGGLIALSGGKEKFVAKLDSLFNGSPGIAGRQQADITGMVGQYAQGNEPSHHVAYLYNYAGAPWKSQGIARRIMDSLYTPKVDGLCGNDDCGQMSAWYVMSAIGLYQVCPGEPSYAIGSPLFSKTVIHIDSVKQFVIETNGNSRSNRYINAARLNGTVFNQPFIEHQKIVDGGTLILDMQRVPNTAWGSGIQNSGQASSAIVPLPFVSGGSKVFAEATTVTLGDADPDAKVLYAIVPEGGTASFIPYTSPLQLTGPAHLRAVAAISDPAGGQRLSDTLTADFIKQKLLGKLQLKTKYSPQYTGGGDNALVDGQRGANDFRLGTWQGYHKDDLDAIVDLGASKHIQRIALGCLQDNNSWIFFPQRVEFSVSDDGETFRPQGSAGNDVSPKQEGALVKDFGVDCNATARYVRVHASNMGICPEWHKGAGEPAWLFVDEIVITEGE